MWVHDSTERPNIGCFQRAGYRKKTVKDWGVPVAYK